MEAGTEILIAEDSPTQSAHLVHLLERHGYVVMAARDGREALSLLEHLSPALVITDVVMPELDGYGLCKAIKSNASLKDIPVMLVTTLADPEDVIRGLECGADNFVRKPYEETYLLSRIRYLLMNRAMRTNHKMQLGIEITFAGQRHFITSDRQQMLDLLISTYEQAVHLNNDLKLREKDLGETNHVLNAMYRIAEGLNRAVTEKEITDLALDQAMELPGVQAGWIMLPSASGFRLAAARNLPPAEWERLQNAPGDTLGFPHQATIPLRADDGTMGVMNLIGTGEGQFREEELRVLENIGNQMAVALDRTRLREHLENLVEERTARLHRSQALLQIASRIGRLGAWAVELPDLTVTWSDEVKAIHEVPANFKPTLEKSIGFYVPEYRQTVEDAFNACLRQGTSFDLQVQIRAASGRLVWVRILGEAERDASGAIQTVHGAFQDISATKEAAEQTRILATRLIDTLESITDAFWTVDREGRITYVNREGERLLRRSRQDLVGKVLFDEFSPARGTRFEEAYNRAMFGRESVEFEEFYEPFGAWSNSRIFPTQQGVAIYARDITEGKKTAQQLEQSEERYRLLFDRHPHPIWVYDGETLAFLAVNEAAVLLYGYSREEFLGMTIKDIRPAEDVDRLLSVLRDQPESPAPRVYGVFKHRKKNGTTLEVEIASSEITFAGRPAGLVLAVDVTEKRRLEQQFFRMQRMESIGTLAGGIAHDLNNLLMPIMMGVTLLKREKPSDRALQALENIEKSTLRGKHLVQQVLSFARGVEGSRVPVHIGDVVREVRSMVESTFPKGITMRFDVPRDLQWIDGDPTQLHQVLLNLLVNARDAMPEGGRITVSASNEIVDEHYASMQRDLSPGRYVMLDVADEGVGMPVETIDRIFEPFFTTKEIGRGTGLGLSTVAAIVRGHGGSISVYSEPGQGSVFKVYLPAKGATEDPAAPRDHDGLEDMRGSGERIMIVDDEASVVAMTQQTLEAFGYRVLAAEDGAQAIGLFALHRADIAVVITDMMMPVMDGATLIAALRRIDPNVPIVASSGLHDDGRMGRSPQADVLQFLQKPYSAEVLLRTLKSVLDSARDDPSQW